MLCIGFIICSYKNLTILTKLYFCTLGHMGTWLHMISLFLFWSILVQDVQKTVEHSPCPLQW